MTNKSQNFLSRLFEGVLGNILANIAMLGLVAIATLIIASFATNQSQTLLIGAIVILASINIILAFRLSRRSRILELKADSVIVYPQAEPNTKYLIDQYGRARLIPDEDTLLYIQNLISNDQVLAWEPDQISKTRGPDIVALSLWSLHRPRAPEETLKRQLEYELGKKLEIRNFDFEPKSSAVNTIVVYLINRGSATCNITRVKFYEKDLKVSSEYSKSGFDLIIPHQNNYLAPDQVLEIRLNLAQTWQRQDIDRLRGDLGTLRLEVMEGEMLLGRRFNL